MGILDRAVKLAPRLVGRGSIAQKAMTAGGIWGGTYATSKFIDHQQDNRRAYYGEERYNSYYGNSVNAAKNFVGVLGTYFGAMALFDRDPISRIKNHASYAFGRGRQLRKELKRGGMKNVLFKPTDGRQAFYHNGVLKTFGGPEDPLVRAAYDNLKVAPRVGLGQAAMYSSLLGSGIMPNYGIVGGAVAGIAGVGGGLLAGVGAYKASKLLLGGGIDVAPNAIAMGIGGGLGYMVGSKNNNNMAEGTITDFMDTGSPVRNMNFSTAGLTLALHKNNRKF